ncbi:MAG: hypothetical protein V7K97_15420 [Nostoc sp.]|uniref:hypothetical protein n=1 Tax=Nostoc sp. TaxID=1180 RepID=UPI002FF7F58B
MQLCVGHHHGSTGDQLALVQQGDITVLRGSDRLPDEGSNFRLPRSHFQVIPHLDRCRAPGGIPRCGQFGFAIQRVRRLALLSGVQNFAGELLRLAAVRLRWHVVL